MYSIENNPKIPRMRTVHEAAQEIKKLDENTALTQWRIRELVLSGILPAVRAGNKLLINLDTLFEYLENPTAEKFQPKQNVLAAVQGIRKIY